MIPPRGYSCLDCGTRRPPEELLAFWPLRDPRDRWFVCRPSLSGACFRQRVGPASLVRIALADTLEASA